jgi:rhodanese-related sulfurtransferase
MERVPQMTPREAYAAYMLDAVVVDVRESADQQKKRANLNSLFSLPMSELGNRYQELPTNRPVAFISKKGKRGREAAEFMLEKGYHNVAVVDGGLQAWEAEGFPTLIAAK